MTNIILIDNKYESRRAFCRDYISLSGGVVTDDAVSSMSNRLSQIIKGKKAIQTYDLPYFTDLLGVSCEQILSAGECSVPISNRVTNYSIACSMNTEEWEELTEEDYSEAEKVVENIMSQTPEQPSLEDFNTLNSQVSNLRVPNPLFFMEDGKYHIYLNYPIYLRYILYHYFFPLSRF